jgi:hypothetical protein
MNDIDKIILWSLKKLHQYHLQRIERKITQIENPDNYEMLLPSIDADKDAYYSKPLTVALKTHGANNIAITGSYGSGKSSFLRTFELKNPQWSYLPISLATFKEPKEIKIDDKTIKNEGEITAENTSTETKEEKPQKDKFELHQDIERSILQQFFYREEDKTIPYSRFKRIRNTHKRNIVIHSILIGFLFLYGWKLFFTKSFDAFLAFDFLKTIDKSIIVSLVLFLLFYYFYKSVQFLWNLQISNFNFKKGEITLAKQEKASILNEHLDEILYFFEVTSYDVVIFEDLDRFDTTEIFIKLRELNNLINNAKQINKRIVFIYAIKDDMFIDKERSKFFDFIIPIIPYINSSNSEAKLKEKFETQIKATKLDTHFIDDISLYIDDMRLLINIYNEYVIYQHNLRSNTLNYNKLLALLLCKNLYPSEFAKLHYREGLIYELFAHKPLYLQESIKKLDDEKQKIKDEIEAIEEENLQSLEELRLLFIGQFVTTTNNAHLRIANIEYQMSKLLEEQNFDLFIHSNDVQSYQKQYNGYRDHNLMSFEAKTKMATIYEKRKEILENKYNDKINELKKALESIDATINHLKNATLQELFTNEYAVIDLNGYEDKALLIFLVRNGYIQEDYEHYISYFHEGSITQNDREFLLSVKNKKPLEATFPLGNTQELIKKLTPKEFEDVAILNFDLLKYLLKNINEDTEKVEAFFGRLSNESDKSITFIFDSFGVLDNQEQKIFIQNLAWKDLWKHIASNFSDEKKDEFFEIIFDALSVEKFIELNINNSLKLFIENKVILPKYEVDKTTKYQKLLSKLNIQYKQIENPADNPVLFDYIYHNNHYELNQTMIETILKIKDIESLMTLNEAHMTTVAHSKAQNLATYIDKNVNTYIEDVFLTIETNTQESEETIIKLLTNENITFDNKIALIKKEETRIKEIGTIEDKELWDTLYSANKIEANWDNIIYYYLESNILTDTLISFLNQKENYVVLSKIKINNEEIFDKSEVLEPFSEAILLASELSDEAYRYLIKSIGYDKYDDLNIEHLSSVKIDYLLNEEKLNLTKENISHLRTFESGKQIILIYNFKNYFLENYQSIDIELKDLIEIMQSEKFIIDYKIHILNLDLPKLDSISKELKEEASRIYICSQKEIVDIGIFEKLIDIENSYTFDLLLLQIPYFDNCDMCKKYLDVVGEPYSELFEKNAKSLFVDKTEQNQILLQLLKDKNCISSFSDEKKELKVNRKRS